MLIAEFGEGNYQPVAAVGSINEAREIAASDMRGRRRRLENDQDPGLCPYEYKVWATGRDGRYVTAATIPAIEL